MSPESQMEDGSAPVVRDENGKWTRGHSGNPAGRPRASRNHVSALCDDILEESAEDLTRIAVQLAIQGDPIALRLCLDRLVPKRKHRPVNLNWPPIRTLDDVDAAMTATLAALGSGEVDIEQANALVGLLDAKRRALETLELEQRVRALEATPVDSLDAAATRFAALMGDSADTEFSEDRGTYHE